MTISLINHLGKSTAEYNIGPVASQRQPTSVRRTSRLSQGQKHSAADLDTETDGRKIVEEGQTHLQLLYRLSESLRYNKTRHDLECIELVWSGHQNSKKRGPKATFGI